MPPKDWKTREQLAILSQVHTNTVSTWLNDNKEKYSDNLEHFKVNIANKEKNKWFINPEEFYKSYPKKITYEHQEHIEESSSAHSPLNSLHNSAKEHTASDREGQGSLISSKDLEIAHNVRDAFGKIGYVIEPKRPFYRRVAFWLILVIIALIIFFIFAYFEHKNAIIVQKNQTAESYKALISSKEEQHKTKIVSLETQYKDKLLYMDQLNKKDLEIKLKEVELIKSELEKTKNLNQLQQKQLSESKIEISKLQASIVKLDPQEHTSSDISTTEITE
jgi:hypothetical protein